MVKRSTSDLEQLEKPTAKPPKATKSEISRVMAAMGRRGGKIGGKRRLVTLTPEQRTSIAQKAAETRWTKRKKSSETLTRQEQNKITK
jgi:hypothetical protein